MTPRILVVEPDKRIVGELAVLLEDFGYEFLGAVSEPGAAVERAQFLHADLVLMEIFFQGAPIGLDLAERLHAETGCRVVLLGNATDPSVFMRMVHADPIGCVTEPIDPHYLHAVLQRAMRGSGALVMSAGD